MDCGEDEDGYSVGPRSHLDDGGLRGGESQPQFFCFPPSVSVFKIECCVCTLQNVDFRKHVAWVHYGDVL